MTFTAYGKKKKLSYGEEENDNNINENSLINFMVKPCRPWVSSWSP